MTRYTAAELRTLRTWLAKGKTIKQIADQLGRQPRGLYHRGLREGWYEHSETRHYLSP